MEDLSADIVVVGTGMVESILAAACARASKRVLHLDARPVYGARSATYSYDALLDYLSPPPPNAAAETPEAAKPHAPRTLGLLHVSDAPRHVEYLEAPLNAPLNAPLDAALDAALDASLDASLDGPLDAPPPPASTHQPPVPPSAPRSSLSAESHRFNIDLTPQLLPSSGAMVSSLRSSGVASYLEFKPVESHIYSASAASALERVPCSKGDIFSSPSLSLLEKRQLMRFLQTCAALEQTLEPDLPRDPNALAAPDAPVAPPLSSLDGSFADFCAAQRLSPRLSCIALYPIAHASSPGTTLCAADGVRAVCRHIRSLGVYGATAYLVGLYGTSELSQGFCRLCAVWGGVYMLARSLNTLRVDGAGRVDGVFGPSGSWVPCEWVVLGADVVVEAAAREPQLGTARCVVVLDGPLLGTPTERISFASLLPADDGGGGGGGLAVPVYALEQDESSAVAPRGKVVLHLSAQMEAGRTPRELLEPALERLRTARRGEDDAAAREPRILWGAFFELPRRVCTHAALPPNVLACDDAPLEVCSDAAVERARDLFERIVPGAPFLPPRPDEPEADDDASAMADDDVTSGD